MKKQTIYSVCKCIVGLILCLSLSSSFLFVYGTGSSELYKPVFEADFDKCVETGYFSGSVAGGNWSYVAPSSKIQAVSGASSIDGTRALQIQQCDIHWTGFKVEEYAYRIGFTVCLDAQFNQNIQFVLSTQDTLTELSSEAGILLEIYNNEHGETILQGSDRMTPLSKLNKGEIYHIELFIERGSADVRIALNGTQLDKSYSYISKVYFIDGIRVRSVIPEGVQDGGSWCIDNISVATRERSFAQPLSGQTPGNPVEVDVPDAPEDAMLVYVNGIRIGVTKTYSSSQTVYISAEQFLKSINVSYVYDKEEDVLIVENDRVSARVSVPDTVVSVNGSTIDLVYPVRLIDQDVMIPPQFINEVFNAKVWWDYDSNLLVITTGAYKNNNQLMRLGTKLYMNGEPYYAVGAYVPEFFQTVMARYLMPGNVSETSWTSEAEVVLNELKSQGVKAIRFSCSTDLLPDLLYDDVSMGKYLEAMDALLNVCDRYGIQVVICFDLISPCFLAKENAPRYGWLYGDEHLIDLVGNAASKSRNAVSPFLEKFVTRYKNRNTILMYELADAGNLRADTGSFMGGPTYSLGQWAAFYQDCVNTIRRSDPDCILSSGDAVPLTYQWSLYQATMQGNVAGTHTIEAGDALDRQFEVLWLLHRCFDVVSVQMNEEFYTQMNDFYYSNGVVDNTELLWYIRAANRFDKPIYSGLSVGMNDVNLGGNGQDDAIDGNLSRVVLSGMSISFWQDLTPAEMTQGTLLLKERYANNAAIAENTNVLWMNGNVDVFDPEQVISADALDDEHQTLDRFLLFVVVSACLIVFSSVIVFAFKNNKKVV
ncbi:MAG: cellulase family glycosylhydrolase [Clostridia bacterium]|nr:cellulase family glycosylhydrolase [Clostridia bacterium]